MQESARNRSRLGANRLSDGSWEFLLWAPFVQLPRVRILANDSVLTMQPLEHGYHRAVARNLADASKYRYILDDGREVPDPASRFQPEGVHGPSQILDTQTFTWTDKNWKGRPLEGSIFYEFHVGTYTTQGTLDAVIPHLSEFVDLGVTTIELMPIAQFPGFRNWGYDGVYEFAPQNTYGGPESLHRFVNAAHLHGLAVALDVVYNHLGPEGNYLNAYGPYFTDRYQTAWGQALNFDGAGSDEVRRFFIENALYWLEDYHFDVLRLDAIHGIFDFSARHFLAELKSEVAALSERLGRHMDLIAESDLNDSRILHSAAQGGYAVDGQWSDDFHHAVHTLLTREKAGYYTDFDGIEPLIATLKDGWFYQGQYSAHRGRSHGNSPRGIAHARFVVCNQNHDQVGNRALGDRLNARLNFEAMKLAAGVTLLSPFTPLLFMGEEYGETAPFQYFTSHGDPALAEAVHKGRREEFAAFDWHGEVPNPQDEETFTRSRLNHSLKKKEPHSTMLRFYRHLISIRKEKQFAVPQCQEIHKLGSHSFFLMRQLGSEQTAVLFNFEDRTISVSSPHIAGEWNVLINSADSQWQGPVPTLAPKLILTPSTELQISPYSFIALSRSSERSL